jgi:hypothetical protein
VATGVFNGSLQTAYGHPGGVDHPERLRIGHTTAFRLRMTGIV